MKLLMHIWSSVFFASALVLFPSFLVADETEIYFARATADNSENKPSANVMIMLDTSGSMRFCEQEFSSAVWCSDINSRRINMLEDALRGILANTPASVNLGLGRFNSSSDGGQILVPIVPINETTKPAFDAALAEINPRGRINSPGNVSPVGGTPTARAYAEMARYMLGNNPVQSYGTNSPSVCIAQATRETNCRNVASWGPWSAWSAAPACVASDSCEIGYTEWENSGVCSPVNDMTCRLSPNWSGWSRTQCSPLGDACERRFAWSIFGYEYRTRGYQARSARYRTRQLVATERVCDQEAYCTETRGILSGGSYSSPINVRNQCESNHIILFTDGQPSGREAVNLDGGEVVCSGSSGNSGTNNYTCQANIATYLNSTSNSKGVPIQTHNIGLYMGGGTTLANMRSVSDAGGGATHDSDNAEELLDAFLNTLDLINEDARSTASPGVAVNTLNRFQHLDQLYYSVFKPVASSYWQGNLKRYQLRGGEVRDQLGSVATDPNTGFFREGSRSFWSNAADGSDVLRGGARERLVSRNLFYTDGVGGAIKAVDFNNARAITDTFPNLSDAQKAEMIQELGAMWGDPLHSVPVMVNYGGADNNYVFVSTNAGMLHAIDTRTGSEVSAFMPFEIMSKADKYTIDRQPLTATNKRQTYGLDGSWTAWRRPGANANAAPSKVYLYGGMRRGGRNYYALDMTDPARPVMLWQINNQTSGFGALGQTWSTPTLTSIPDNSVANGRRAVVVFGGGYSPADHDDGAGRRSAGDSMGNAVYIVDALTGALIWSTSTTYSVPAGIAVVDLNFDGIADHLYFGDLGGQVFRVDIDKTGAGGHSLAKIAELGGSGTNHRRFYEAPAVAYVKSGAIDELYIGIGSGYRAHPLDESTSEGIFVIRDRSAITGTGTTAVSLADLTDVTDGREPDSNSRGWYYLFDRAGEKVLASPAVFDGRLVFTTYSPTPDEVQIDPCVVSFGQSYLHAVNLRTAQPAPVTEWTGGGDGSTASRSMVLKQTTPAPTPNFLVDPDGKVIVLVGTEVVGEGDLGDPRLRKRRWMQLPRDEANAIKVDAGSAVDE